MADNFKLSYWPILAKNVAASITMELAGADWEVAPGPGSKGTGDLWGEWLEQKPTTVWGYLPNLQIPGGKVIGNELSILQYLARKYPEVAGADDNEWLISEELIHQSEELYQKMSKLIPTIMATDKSPEEFQTFMDGSDKTTHSSAQGLQVYLNQFENFYTKCGGKDGKFTNSGTTVGEIKLFSTIVLLIKIKADVVANFPNLTAFCDRLNADPKVKSVLEGTAKNMTGPPMQYFIAPPAAAA